MNKDMNKLTALVILITLTLPILPSGESGMVIVVQTRSNDLTMDMNISDMALASFNGENDDDNSGSSVSIMGDVNGDGYDDMLISSFEYDERRGITYLILGHPSGWSLDTDLSMADASFLGENKGDTLYPLSGVGDVNGDGFDDFIIGAYFYGGVGNNYGKVYLILGKASGWARNVSLSNADASFIGEYAVNAAGISVSGAGDVNGDGYGDFIIAASANDEGGTDAGQIYLILGRSSGWSRDVSLSSADASFIGDPGDLVGDSISGAGDVNGDGYDDFIIGTFYGSIVYLIYGRSSGWTMDMYLSSISEATFIGEGSEPTFGRSVSGGGDINGDGLDDILFSANLNSEGGTYAGQTYLFFGRSSGWGLGMEMSEANASFIGESDHDMSGNSFCGSGDVNGDGYDDILIAAYQNKEGGPQSGQTYLVLGRSSGWTQNMNLSMSDGSFIGESAHDLLGRSVSNSGDVNGDGCDDILIGAIGNDGNGVDTGRTYLVTLQGFSDPKKVFGVDVKDMGGITISSADIGEKVQVEMTGLDRDPMNQDRARINFTSGPKVTRISLTETGINTGVYRGLFTIPLTLKYLVNTRFSAYVDNSKYKDVLIDYQFRPSTITSIGVFEDSTCNEVCDRADFYQTVTIQVKGFDTNDLKVDKAFATMTSDKDPSLNDFIILDETGASTGIYHRSFRVPTSMQYFENITITSLEDPAKNSKFMVHTPVQIRAKGPLVDAFEDQEYRMGFYNFGYNSETWTFSTDAYWLSWDDDKEEVFGIPRNNDVGNNVWEIMLTAEDSFGNGFDLNYTLSVINTPPAITTEPIFEIMEKEDYYLDIDSNDDGQGEISWYLYTTSPFLEIQKGTGVLTGTPIEGEAGEYIVNVQVNDGNGGSNSLIFNLTVIGQNDKPTITTTDIKQIEQDTPFRRDYDAFDPDEADTQFWTLRTDADWLYLENGTGVLFGTPDGFDIGDWQVNITVTDSGGLNDSREFTLKVLDKKDKPIWVDVPSDIELVHGTEYHFDANATDPDKGSTLYYSIDSNPVTDIRINSDTGDIGWTANYRSMPKSGGIIVSLTASDGELFATYIFMITVTPTESPSVELTSPQKGARTPSTETKLEWIGTDPENEPLSYTLYLAESESYVMAKRTDDIAADGITESNYTLTGLTQGKTYYWTLVPDDGCTYGQCTNGILSFRVNNRPVLKEVLAQDAESGREFNLKLEGSDSDQDDKLTYSIISGPDGMTVRSETGMIVWTPKESQTGIQKVRVRVTDGYESVERSFDVEVIEGSALDMGLVIGIGIGLLILIIIILLIYIFVIKGRSPEKEDEDDEAKRIQDEMEQHQREREWEEAHTRGSDHTMVSDVPISVDDAYAHDHSGKSKGSWERKGGRMEEE